MGQLAVSDDPRPTAPTWMDATAPSVGHRRGAVPLARSALPTWTFFGLIVLAVATAGIVAISVWGPDKTPRNRTQFATHPPVAATAESKPSPEPAVNIEPAAAEPEATVEPPAPPPKKAKKPGRRTYGKKGR